MRLWRVDGQSEELLAFRVPCFKARAHRGQGTQVDVLSKKERKRNLYRNGEDDIIKA